MADKFDQRFSSDPEVAADLGQTLATFAIRLALVPQPMDDGRRREIMDVVHQRLFNKLNSLSLNRTHIGHSHTLHPSDISKHGKRSDKKPWLSLHYTEAGRGFAIHVADSFIGLVANGLSIKTTVELSANVLQELLYFICRDPEVSAALDIHGRAHRISCTFGFKFRLGHFTPSRQQPRVAKNYEVILAALRLEPRATRPTPADYAEAEAFPSLNLRTSDFVRVDYRQHAYKLIDGSAYEIVTVVEAPFDEHNSILHVKHLINSDDAFFGEKTGFDLDRSLKLEIPFIYFLKDTVLKQFHRNLLCKVDIKATEQ